MADLAAYQYVLIGLLFVYSAIVRSGSGFGFGGAVFALPFLLLIDNQPLVYLPIIAIHLIIFSSFTIYSNHTKNRQPAVASGVDWQYLKKALGIIIIPKMIGVFGLLTLPPKIMTVIIFCIITVYAFSYMLNKPFRSNSHVVDVIFLCIGGYISGTSLIGAPLIVAVFAKHVAKEQLRDTLFALWFILVCIKMASFIFYGIDLQWVHQLWLFPCACLGHVIGLRLHSYLMTTDNVKFYRIFGAVLLLTSIGGIAKVWL